jgi:hypothetical protein
MKKKSAGRPPLPKGKAKDNTLLIRLSPVEREEVDDMAKFNGQKSSAWARHILLAAARQKV